MEGVVTGWDAGMRALEEDLYTVVLTLLCPAGRHRMARLYRLDPLVEPKPAGEVLLHGEVTGRWSDGKGHELHRERGADLVVAADGVTPQKLNVRCPVCPGRRNPQPSWLWLLREADKAVNSSQRRASVALTI